MKTSVFAKSAKFLGNEQSCRLQCVTLQLCAVRGKKGGTMCTVREWTMKKNSSDPVIKLNAFHISLHLLSISFPTGYLTCLPIQQRFCTFFHTTPEDPFS